MLARKKTQTTFASDAADGVRWHNMRRKMESCGRLILLTGLALSAWLLWPAAAAEPTNQWTQVRNFELHDQFGQTHRLQFPRTNLMLLVVADREGATQIDAWVQPLRQRYSNQLEIAGVADVAAAPRWMSNSITRRFQREQRQPVMLDWSGAVCRELRPRKGQANLFLLDHEGRIRHRWTGAANRANMQQVFDAIDQTGR